MVKKVFFCGLAAVLASGFLAQASEPNALQVSLMGREFRSSAWVNIQLTTLNKKLKKQELPQFEKSIVLKKNDGKKYLKILEQVRVANKALGRKIEMIDHGYFYQLPETCYTGETSAVIDTINGLRDGVFHTDMGISAIRYGKIKVLFYEGQTIDDNAEVRAIHEQNNPEAVAAWDHYKKKSDDVLVLSDFGPQGDGTELTATLIKRCD